MQLCTLAPLVDEHGTSDHGCHGEHRNVLVTSYGLAQDCHVGAGCAAPDLSQHPPVVRRVRAYQWRHQLHWHPKHCQGAEDTRGVVRTRKQEHVANPEVPKRTMARGPAGVVPDRGSDVGSVQHVRLRRQRMQASGMRAKGRRAKITLSWRTGAVTPTAELA